ncbi:MAG: outer rane biosis protein BamB [Gemmataceae bacterium]|nr:outer rane biosis protein BamB [Gemmataceae bacterium]
MSRLLPLLALPVLAVPLASAPVRPEAARTTWPMFGGSPGRNMANLIDRNIPEKFDPGRQSLWKADLGSHCYTQSVVAGGVVLVGTNNERPRNNRDTRRKADDEGEPVDKNILMCFDEKTGKFLWQAVFDRRPFAGVDPDWPKVGVCSTPSVVGDRVYVVNNRCTVVCIDLKGFTNGNQGIQTEKYQTPMDADVIWEFNMEKELGVFPHRASASSPLVIDDAVFVVTGNGVDEGHVNIPSPDAPSFIALDRHTGKLRWKDNSPGKNILHGQWSSPAYAAEPVPQVIFPGGDGWIRAFDPTTGKLLWKFDGNPKGAVYELGGVGNKSDFVATPVVHNGRVYIAVGQDPEHTDGVGRMWCIDLARAIENGARNKDRDVSPVDNNFDPAAPVNRTSALSWYYGGEEKRKWAVRGYKFGRTMSTACIVDDVLYVGELPGYVHCFDARTGNRYWSYDTKSAMWGSCYYADGKVFIGNDHGDLYVWKHTKTPASIDDLDPNAPDLGASRAFRRGKRQEIETKYLLAKIEFDAPIRIPPTVAGGVLYVATEKTLYAIKKP